VIEAALAKAKVSAGDLAAVGITNQRETTVLWDAATGAPLHNAIVWMDTRTQAAVDRLAGQGLGDVVRSKTGLPLATYFSALKLGWLFDEIPGARASAAQGKALFGTIDSWIIWNLTGGPGGGRHIIDATNASRTQLMNLQTLGWDDELLRIVDIPAACLPEIRSSSEVYGECVGALAGVPLAGALGDQHAALLGQACVNAGDAKGAFASRADCSPVTCAMAWLCVDGVKLDGLPVMPAQGTLSAASAASTLPSALLS